ncbi:acetate/propionate family kinase [Chitinivorax sp. PXF-14]|uniref:acetate/propionate family kinase n=1 Tax=Chitinivorax sp. PXF-14 TaxID=3230488 RepID=UPI0034672F69
MASLLVLNAGSSSLKFSLFTVVDGHEPQLGWRGQIEGLGAQPRFSAADAGGGGETTLDLPANTRQPDALALLLDWIKPRLDGELVAVGHRMVHGGTQFAQPIRIDDGVLDALRALIPLAPLHQPHNLAPIEALRGLQPDLPQVACFDTAFHRTIPKVAQFFALPLDYAERGVRRYGFHGLSYQYIAGRLAEIDPRGKGGRTVVAHLGSGASMCAMARGRSVASTMGFTAVEGLIMSTRCGSIDPGVILYLESQGMSLKEVETLIYKQSGLLGISGLSGDMRQLLASDDPRARLAVDMFCYRVARQLGSLAAALQGLDGVVFTAGIGERSVEIRRRVCELAAWLGINIDPRANAAQAELISTPASRVAVRVIPTNEELVIARGVRDVMRRAGSPLL